MSLDSNKPFRRLLTPVVECANTAPKLGFPWGAMSLVALTLFLAIVGCASDADNIRATNEADRTPPATSTPLSAEIGSTEVQEGDCINSRLPKGIDIESVVIVPCNTNWQYRALNSFEVDDLDRYPGESSFERRAYRECDRRYTNFLFPTAESWALSDRMGTCLQESFGLSVTNPSKLDRLISSSRLDVDECFNEAPETDDILVELVSCTGEWQYRVLNKFEVDDASRYPGEDTFSRRAQDECDRRSTTIRFPTADSWPVGDRSVTCLQDSFGLSSADPAKLDRLADLGRLDVGECFNEAPETGGLFVEIVSCSGESEFQVGGRFLIPIDGAYPGEDHIEEIANRECGDSFDFYYYPSAESWSLGGRTITCVKSAE